MTSEDSRARWVRDLARFLPLKSQFVLTGNVRDLQTRAIGARVVAVPLSDVIGSTLTEAGYEHIVRYDPLAGFTVLPRPDGSESNADEVLAAIGLTAVNGKAPAGTDLLASTMERIVAMDGPPIALVVDFASRLVVRNDALSASEHQLFTRALVLSQTARPRPVGPDRAPRFNSVVWIAEKEGDLPDWLLIDNPKLRHISLAPPDRATRQLVAASLVRGIPGAKEASADVLREAEDDLVDSTEGLLLVDLNAVVQLSRAENVVVSEVAEAVRRYKVGVTEDAWRKLERAKISNGAAAIGRRVIGQDHAAVHMLDIIKRAATGIGTRGRGGRPRGVAFLAGPTGVGKTELAKTVTELLFGDESAYIRFDMSEFSAEHADQRLIGAPPGYVGYDVGGELTNAVRERPFSVVLFDEIEKAHPRILDKFLQILDDGVLTSGRGDRVYFSEALIIFTSNLGIYSTAPDGSRVANVTPDQPFEEVRSRVRGEIENHFKLVLNRPEILNRFGENVIVFDFIRPEVADGIFTSMVNRVVEDASAGGRQISIAPPALEKLRILCTADLANGGRGIRNKIEAHLINPLARGLFDREDEGAVVIDDVVAEAVTSLVLRAA
ncbi:AAA family ATPase [Novosphingobium sp. P6W]|uniref:AAA family ATPase n=1 Tax=Novosphingobium sp. P6W TaxID=1609758 RepID=UPI0005C2BD85|nr:AAA family ATPase [Novosphingobium sp. P6W]AXB75510.1 ATP-dependent Clp protease ATP-binding subunit [Novosphingobium sp. P6W]KIS32474.1 ATPase [Novosphingobium sp. P6W]